MRCAHVLPTMVTDHDQQNEVASHLEDGLELQEGFFPNDEKTQKYGNLLFLLQSEPRHIAHLCRLVSMAEIDALLQTVMFTIYGNQYESREEHLLLTMFQVRKASNLGGSS
jgi:Ras GTPase-activating-like protein IQGAP2/3